MDKPQNIQLIQLSNYVKPEIKESYGRKWVLNGDKNSFFQYIIDRKNGSPTNSAVLKTYKNLLFGRGIAKKGQSEVYEELVELFSKNDQRNTLDDMKTFGMCAFKLVRSVGQGVAKVKHFPMDKLGMGKANEKGEIDTVYYCFDWRNTSRYKPEPIKLFNGKMTDKEMILLYKPYEAGSFYYSYPDYLAGLQYAEIEEEISNFSINHIKNGLSFGYVINFNNGDANGDEMKLEIERRIKQKLTGSSNAGKFILSFNEGKEAEVTVVPLDVNDAHNQWESLREDAKFQILTTHGVTSPLLFAIQSSTGFSSNADELNTASKVLQDLQISPLQEAYLDVIKPVLELAGLETDLEFIELRESYTDEEKKEEVVVDDAVDDVEEEIEEKVEMSEDVHYNIEALLSEGEEIDYNEWQLVDDRRCDLMTLDEVQLNTIFKFARVPQQDKNIEKSKSIQDTSLFKVRYRYAGNKTPERDFCQKLIFSNKVFKAEVLNREQYITPKMGKNGTNTYNPFLFKGGVNCKHWWQRVIFLKKDNKEITVNKARKMILELEPEDRDDAKWEKNDPRVAQSASASNNFWKYK